MATQSRPVQVVSNTELYNRWAKVYDTDGNILQAIDDLLIPTLLNQAFQNLPSTSPSTITELGCGTGRNTTKLLTPKFSTQISAINALDLSIEMLELARQRCKPLLLSTGSAPSVTFHQYDALNPHAHALPSSVGEADLVLSTLVLEHLPLDVFFGAVTKLLKKNGSAYLVLTNMHSEMGSKSQAGFVDPKTGEKIRGMSFVYQIDEVVEEAKKWGFKVCGEMTQRHITELDIKASVVGDRGLKWVGCNVWFGCVMKLSVGSLKQN